MQRVATSESERLKKEQECYILRTVYSGKYDGSLLAYVPGEKIVV